MGARRPPALWEDATLGRQLALALPVSLVLHAVLLALVLVQGFLGGPRRLEPPPYEVMLVGPIRKGTPGGGAPARPAAATDPRPDAAVAPAPPPKAVSPDALAIPASTPKAAKPGSTPIPSAADARQEALARAQREAALRRAQELAAKSAGTGGSPIPSAGGPAAPANAAGGSGEGAGDGGAELGVDWSTLSGAATYEQQIQAIVNANWLPPTWVSDRQLLVCTIRVLIAFDGKIASTRIESSSDNAAFDASALAALRKSDPLPPPPLDLKPYLAKKGLPLRFDSRSRSAARAP